MCDDRLLENIADLVHSEIRLFVADLLCAKDFDMLEMISSDEIKRKICNDKAIKAKLQEIIKCPNEKIIINHNGDYASVYEAFVLWIIGRIGIKNKLFLMLETKRLYSKQNLCKSYAKIQNLHLQKAKKQAMLAVIKGEKLKNTKHINGKNNATKSSGFMGGFIEACSEGLKNIDKGILDKMNLQVREALKQIGEDLKQNSERISLDLKGFFNEK